MPGAPMPPRYHVILNPASGAGAGRKLRDEVERELASRGIAFTLEETARRGHAVELARAAAERGEEAVVAVGGDGTVHEVANGLMAEAAKARPMLAVIPVGTGNDFSKLLESGPDRSRAYDALAAGAAKPLDVGHARWDGGGEFFVNGMGTGVDVEVVRQIERLPRLPGVVKYLVGLLRAVVGFRAIPLGISADAQREERRLMILSVGNGPCQGGGFWTTPRARADDGRLDICMVDDLSYFQIARTIPRVMRGTHEELAVVTMRRAARIEVEAPEGVPLFFQLDGELRQPEGIRRLEVSVCPGALRVIGGRGGADRSRVA